jgi:rhodanese-related sulfurtransferase
MKLVKQTTVEYKTIRPSEICEYIKQHKDAVLLDVRTKEEFEGTKYPEHGTIRNAINIPIQDLESRLDELAAYKDRELIVYCSHSKRSPRASYFLMQKGFSNVTNLEGGMSVMKDDDCVQRK